MDSSPPAEDVQRPEVSVPVSGPVAASLGSLASIPCSLSLASSPAPPSAAAAAPRLKWSVVSGDVETQILVWRGDRVKVSEAYRGRAWVNDTSLPDDLSLWLEGVRSSDAGHYRCRVQRGLEEASALIPLTVRGGPHALT